MTPEEGIFCIQDAIQIPGPRQFNDSTGDGLVKGLRSAGTVIRVGAWPGSRCRAGIQGYQTVMDDWASFGLALGSTGVTALATGYESINGFTRSRAAAR